MQLFERGLRVKCFLIVCVSPVRYTGSMDGSNLNDKKTAKHDQRILMALVSDRKLFDLINRLVVPAQRYYRREARKAAKNNA